MLISDANGEHLVVFYLYVSFEYVFEKSKVCQIQIIFSLAVGQRLCFTTAYFSSQISRNLHDLFPTKFS